MLLKSCKKSCKIVAKNFQKVTQCCKLLLNVAEGCSILQNVAKCYIELTMTLLLLTF